MGNCIHRTKSVRVNATGTDVFRSAEQQYLDLDADMLSLMNACSDGEPIAKMAALVQSTYGNEKADYDCCVYAIEAVDCDHTKIGISHNPWGRINAMQVAHYAELRFAGMVWVKDNNAALQVERLVLKAAKEMGVRARGEWIATDGDEALGLILKAARYAKADVADSATALANINERVLTLFNIRRSVREAVND